jgi:hypothetical protein
MPIYPIVTPVDLGGGSIMVPAQGAIVEKATGKISCGWSYASDAPTQLPQAVDEALFDVIDMRVETAAGLPDLLATQEDITLTRVAGGWERTEEPQETTRLRPRSTGGTQ